MDSVRRGRPVRASSVTTAAPVVAQVCAPPLVELQLVEPAFAT